uniref:Uncharacterized protein n=1 Tax=Angiostrongylus cantonensis TaxID=6313 RepID=A0A0K0CUL4_ANGCA
MQRKEKERNEIGFHGNAAVLVKPTEKARRECAAVAPPECSAGRSGYSQLQPLKITMMAHTKGENFAQKPKHDP